MEDKKIKFDWPIVGHSVIVNYLQNSILKNKLAHAYLFVGPQGLGKSTVARYFANSLLCQNDKIKPCQTCSSCEELSKGTYADFFFLEKENDKKNISIEQIRELKERLSLGSFLNSYKIAVIEDSEYLSIEASNSLLKTLEEPTAKTVLILITQDISLLPKTIISRCQVVNFSLVPKSKIYDHLVDLGSNRDDAKNLSHLSEGRPARAISFFQNKTLLEDYKDKVDQLVRIGTGSIHGRFETIDDFISIRGSSIENVASLAELLDVWLSVLRDAILVKNSLADFASNIFLENQLKSLSNKYSLIQLKDLIDKIRITKQYLYKNINPRLAMENLVLYF